MAPRCPIPGAAAQRFPSRYPSGIDTRGRAIPSRLQRWLPVAGALVLAACAGSAVVVGRYAPHFGSAGRCEGIGFGCEPIQLTDTIVALALLWVGLATTAVAAFVFVRVRWWVAGGGGAATWTAVVLLAGSMTIRYPVARISVSQGRASAEAALAAMTAAVGPTAPYSPVTTAYAGPPAIVEAAPTAAGVLAALPRPPEVPCRDVRDKPMGASRFDWEARATALVAQIPRDPRPQVRALAAALRDAGWTVEGGRDLPQATGFTATLAGPAPGHPGDAPWVRDYRAAVSVDESPPGVSRLDPARAWVRVEVSMTTPCLGPDRGRGALGAPRP